MSDALEDLPTRTLGGDPCGIEEALAEAAEAEAQGAGDLARISAGVAGLTAVVSSYGNIAASGNGAAAEHGVSVLLLRGLRVRMGCASGVHSQAEVSYNTRMARTIYSGRPLAAAKAISGAGAGGIVLVSQCTHRLILKQRADAGGKQAAGYVELSLSDSVRAVGGDAAAAGSQRALFWYGGCAVLDPQLPPIELYQAATPAQALRWSALPLPASGPKVQPLSLCVQSAPVGQLAVAVVAVSGAGCIGTLEAPELAAGEGRDALDEPGTSPMWRAVAEQLWGEAARLCLAHGGYLSTRRSALIAMAPEVMADSVAAGPMSSAAANNSGDGVAGEYEKAPAAGRPQRRSLELARIGAALKAAGGGGRALRERAGRAGQVLLTAVFPSPTAAALWCAELLATGLCAPWPEQLLQSELGEAMWVGPGAVPAMEQLQKAPQEQQRQQVPPPPLQPHAQPAAAGASAAGGTTSASQMFCGTSSDVCGNVSGSAPAFMLGTSSKVSSGSQWHFRTSASPSQPHLLSASSQQQQQQLQQQQMQLFDKLPVSPADALGPLAPLQAHGGNSITAGSRAAAAEQPGQVASVEVDVEAVQQGSEPWRVEEPTMATAAMPASLDKPTHMHLQQHQQPTQQPTTTGVAISPPSAYTAVAGRAVGEAPEAEPASGAGPRQGADAASTHVVPGSEPLLCPYPWRDSGGGPEPDLRHSPARLPAAVLGQLVCRGPRLRAGVEFGSAAVEINPLTGAARYEGAAVSRAMALALSAPVTRVHVSERVAAAVGRMTAGSAESAAAGAECDGASASASALAGYLRSENGGALPPAEMLAFLRSALLVFGSGPQGMLAKQQ
ncbi:hypothetical protein HYH02_010814 [Chlamydomonas schloesseri]|uniref:Uncharacterized protein n=1 Tax=Chlamydomonas schloesseri TaxID=2026947 RepID=A0A835W5R8_9CHLO|nr:hypothetical protein HYH02_010814 [Chlamydomonas schloesseri]|eukprot:KAG2438358.1 hypothetical protein HYH02_010814 [Chlamydomonas schloesseri]